MKSINNILTVKFLVALTLLLNANSSFAQSIYSPEDFTGLDTPSTPPPTSPSPSPSPTICTVRNCLGQDVNMCNLDTNRDGEVNQNDAQLVIDYLNTRQNGVPELDVNGDGRISAFDSLTIINYINSISCPSNSPSPSQSPSPSPSLPPEVCDYFQIDTEMVQQRGVKSFGGDYQQLSCLNDLVRRLTGGRFRDRGATFVDGGPGDYDADTLVTEDNRHAQNDDKVMRGLYCLATYGTLGCTDEIFGLHTLYLDTNCRPIPPSERTLQCGTITMKWFPTPISLLWSSDVSIEDVGVITRFPVSPSKDSWHIWRGSAATPLLVFDPHKTGKVLDATQLFGNYTFGGKLSMDEYAFSNVSLNSKTSSKLEGTKEWRDGFEAMSALDFNKDGVLTGLELESLALWFDRNQNGISELGEVIQVKEVGITELGYRGAVKDRLGNLKLNSGYKLGKNGGNRSGALVDWHSSSYSTREEGLEALQARSIFNNIVNEQEGLTKSDRGDKLISDPRVKKLNSPNPKKDENLSNQFSKQNILNPLSIWEWKVDSDKQKLGHNSGGYLFLGENGKKLFGASMIEVGLKNDSANMHSVVQFYKLDGAVARESEKVHLSFEVESSQPKILTTSTAVISLSDGTMQGQSKVRDESGNEIKYDWKAKKVGEFNGEQK